ncbi:MAG: hypothetical protein HRU29_09880 [Rhizobiales bacterium]|nr:hypothetical protein [Hyphomicrobiales bacterium]NRB14700.1 hypothetical protein [Hyphomicrobiales bacterium]
MNVGKTPNTNFSHLNDKPKTATYASAQKSSETAAITRPAISQNRQLVPTQVTEYKRFNSERLHVNNPFLAQYIHQVKSQKRRAFIGRKAAWQAKISYQNSANIINMSQNTALDTKI